MFEYSLKRKRTLSWILKFFDYKCAHMYVDIWIGFSTDKMKSAK